MPGEENACLIWLGDTEAYQYNLTAKHRIYILPKTHVQKPIRSQYCIADWVQKYLPHQSLQKVNMMGKNKKISIQ